VDGVVEIVISGALQDEAARPHEPRRLALHHVISAQAPFIKDHQLRGRAVVPLVVVADMMADALRRVTGHVGVLCIEQLEVLRGVVIEQATSLMVVAQESAERVGRWSLTVGLEGERAPRYRAQASLSAREVADVEPAWSVGGESSQTAIYEQEIGQGPLFHGEALRVIDEVTTNGEGSWRASVTTAGVLDWVAPHGRWRVDVAAQDAALQLALWWAWRGYEALTVPMSVARLRLCAQVDEETLAQRVVVRPRVGGTERFVADAWVVDERGRVLAAWEGVGLVKMS
jgi:hypothetical protein